MNYRNIDIKGKQGDMMKYLKEEGYFKTNFDAFIYAIIIAINENKFSDFDKRDKKGEDTKILADKLNQHADLLDDLRKLSDFIKYRSENNDNETIDKIFDDKNEYTEESISLLIKRAYYGLNVLYEKAKDDCTSREDKKLKILEKIILNSYQ